MHKNKLNLNRNMKTRHGSPKKEAMTPNELDTKYQAAVDLISIEGWISRLGEEGSELAAAISKYERVKNHTFPCSTTIDEAWADVLREMADVELALKAVKKKMANSSAMPKYESAVTAKKNKLLKQVKRAQEKTREAIIHGIPAKLLSIHIGLGDNPMRDAVVEDLYD